MKSSDVIFLYEELKKLGVQVWLDGGCGVDALLGVESRSHGDVDIIVQEKDLKTLVQYLESSGYKNIPRDDTRAWNFVMGDDKKNFVDVHVVVFDVEGNGIYGSSENNSKYPASSFLGVGTIVGKKVKCVTADYQLISHTGYKLRSKDYLDMIALSQKFNLDLPKEYNYAQVE